MSFFARLSPFRAIRDLRMFLSQRRPYELGFLLLSVAITGVILVGFAKDSHFEKAYKPDIIYVKQWTLDRTDEQIRKQQIIDQVQIDKDTAERKRQEAALQAQWKRLDDKLNRWGI